jgi:hypothetical protein
VYVGRHYSPSSLLSSHFMCHDWHSLAALHMLVAATHSVGTVDVQHQWVCRCGWKGRVRGCARFPPHQSVAIHHASTRTFPGVTLACIIASISVPRDGTSDDRTLHTALSGGCSEFESVGYNVMNCDSYTSLLCTTSQSQPTRRQCSRSHVWHSHLPANHANLCYFLGESFGTCCA